MFVQCECYMSVCKLDFCILSSQDFYEIVFFHPYLQSIVLFGFLIPHYLEFTPMSCHYMACKEPHSDVKHE